MQPIKTNRLILLTISLLVIMASALGLLIPGFYANRDNAITTYEIAGQDIVSLIVGILLFLHVLGSKRGNNFPVVVTGLLVYAAYTYAYFSFGLLTSKIYAIYMIITGLSFYSIISMMMALKAGAEEVANSRQKSISIYLIVVIALVGIIDGKDIVMKTILSNGAMDTKGAFYILDLAFLFPAIILASVVNLKGKVTGRFFTGAFLIKTIALMPALILSDILHCINNGAFVDSAFDVIAFIVMVSAIVFYYIYHKDMAGS
jgi:hypothetical protein